VINLELNIRKKKKNKDRSFIYNILHKHFLDGCLFLSFTPCPLKGV
jgi:hypothetical protein